METTTAENKNHHIEKITADNYRPGFEHREGYLVRYNPHESFGWLCCRTFASLSQAETFVADELTPEGTLKR